MMRKILFIGFLCIFTLNSLAQENKIQSTGSVGIGTLNPRYLFQVQKNSVAPAFMIGGGISGSPSFQLYDLDVDGSAWMGMGVDMSGNSYEHSIYFPTAPAGLKGRLTLGDYNGSTYNVRMSILNNGHVGVGTNNPNYNLQVQKNSVAPALMIGGGLAGSPRLQIYGLDSDDAAWMGMGTDMGGGPYEHSIYFPTAPAGSKGSLTIGDYNGTTYNVKMSVLNNGNVGIGTKSPTERLAVNGNIRAREIKVENGNWPDYVFDQEYQVTPIDEMEKFIKLNKHLEGMPSAKEVHANGINLSEMNALLLKKIEELTLIVIEQNKRIEKLENKQINF